MSGPKAIAEQMTEQAFDSLGRAALDLQLAGPNLTSPSEAARAISIARTYAETAQLWARMACDLMRNGLVVLFVLAAFVPLARAQTAAVTAKLAWAAPTKNTDGSAITLPLTYRVYYGSLTMDLPAGTTATVPNVAPGTCFELTAWAGGIESARSAKSCLPAAPNAPGGFTVTVVVQVTVP